jgi:hypothetical protein
VAGEPSTSRNSAVACSYRSASRGDLARAALAVLAESPLADQTVIADAIGLAQRPDRSGLEVVGVLSMVGVVLQTEVKVERDPDGKWHILLHKRPARDSTVGQLLSKLIGYFTHTG